MDKSLRGLKALPEAVFPKKCACCGRVYQTAEQFLEQTQGIKSGKSSLKQTDDDGLVLVEVFRNCVCGSTLMDEFHSRRDESEEGRRRRAEYARLHGLVD